MRKLVVSLFSGGIFGAGLVMSQMTDPQRILGFLSLGHDWDPTLLFVMVGALLITIPGYRLLQRMQRPLCNNSFSRPASWPPDYRLLAGAALFGIGWGLTGYCPGPAIVAAGLGRIEVILILIPAMLTGGILAGMINRD